MLSPRAAPLGRSDPLQASVSPSEKCWCSQLLFSGLGGRGQNSMSRSPGSGGSWVFLGISALGWESGPSPTAWTPIPALPLPAL